jgi:hypothetical protein
VAVANPHVRPRRMVNVFDEIRMKPSIWNCVLIEVHVECQVTLSPAYHLHAGNRWRRDAPALPSTACPSTQPRFVSVDDSNMIGEGNDRASLPLSGEACITIHRAPLAGG